MDAKPKSTKASPETPNAKPTNKSKSKLGWIIGSVVTVVVITSVALLCFTSGSPSDDNTSDDASQSTDYFAWQDMFYDYLASMIDGGSAHFDVLDLSQMQNTKVYLVQQPDWSTPMMIISYHATDSDDDYTAIIYYQEGHKKLSSFVGDSYILKHYYNKVEETDFYYMMQPDLPPESNLFGKLDASYMGEEGPEYIQTVAPGTRLTDTDRVKCYVFDDVFVALTNPIGFPLTSQTTIEELRANFDTALANIKTTQEKTAEIVASLQQEPATGTNIDSDSTPDSNSASSEGVMLGEHLVKFGTYRIMVEGDTGGRFYLNSDGTVKIVSANGKTENYTYKVETYGYTQDPSSGYDYYPSIVLYLPDGTEYNAWFRNPTYGTLVNTGLQYLEYAGA